MQLKAPGGFVISETLLNSKKQIDSFGVDNIEKIRRRDPESLAKLFTEMNPKLLKFVSSKGVFAEFAEEIIHDSWEVFFSGIDRFEARSSLQTYIFGIVVNKIREHRRRIAKVDYEEDSEAVFERAFTPGGWWATHQHDPEQILSNKGLGRHIEQCLEGLTDSQRNAFMLIEAQDETPENACNILNVSVTHLRVLIFRAKNKLKLCLEGIASV